MGVAGWMLALLDGCGLVAGGAVVLAALPCVAVDAALAGIFAAGGTAAFGAGAAAGALNAPLLLCVPGSMRCGAAPHPARPMTAIRQGREPADRRRGKSLAFDMARSLARRAGAVKRLNWALFKEPSA